MRFLPLLILLFACKPKTEETPLVVGTYNAGLALGFVTGTEARTPEVAEAVGSWDADVVCLQEVWLPDQVAAIDDAASAFPERLFPEPQQAPTTGPGACADGDLDSLLTCVTDNCATTCVDQLADCVFANCPLQFLGLDKPCQSCVMANVGQEVADVEATCESVAEAYAYGGSFGTGLLSKHPVTLSEELVLESTTNRRGVLHAIVDAPQGIMDVYCTHLTAVFALIPYPRETGSWEIEQKAQIDEMIGWIGETQASDRLVVMGDFNTGPDGEDVVAEVPDNWALFEAAGWSEADPEDCTFCADNPLNAGGDGESVWIDHILTDGITGEFATTRMFTEDQETLSCGETVPAALSDHYGVQLTVGPAAEPL